VRLLHGDGRREKAALPLTREVEEHAQDARGRHDRAELRDAHDELLSGADG
jgi:hypothetical protein